MHKISRLISLSGTMGFRQIEFTILGVRHCVLSKIGFDLTGLSIDHRSKGGNLLGRTMVSVPSCNAVFQFSFEHAHIQSEILRRESERSA
jgi:hypothetical protein